MLKKNSNAPRGVIKNTAMLYIMNITKMALPLVTLPYLTRVLSKDTYGVVVYVKAIMQYMQIVVDFGFILSATRDIVQVREDRDAINKVLGDTILAKLILIAVASVSLICMIIALPILRTHVLFTLLSFVAVALSCFLMDFLFRGIEQMQVITYRYITMKGIAAALTFLFVKNDGDLLWIPILDILGVSAALALVFWEMKKRNYAIRFTKLKDGLAKLKESSVYFLSDMAATTFSALNTCLVGIFVDKAGVAEWGLCLQMATAVLGFYTPVADGIYPYMVKNKDLNLVKKILIIFMSIISAGCIFTFVVAKQALFLLGGEKYITAAPLLRAFIPLLFFSFPATLVGWPMLGAIGKVKETTATTVAAAVVQVSGIFLLLLTGHFTVLNLALLRGVTELCMFLFRFGYCWKYRAMFQ